MIWSKCHNARPIHLTDNVINFNFLPPHSLSIKHLDSFGLCFIKKIIRHIWLVQINETKINKHFVLFISFICCLFYSGVNVNVHRIDGHTDVNASTCMNRMSAIHLCCAKEIESQRYTYICFHEVYFHCQNHVHSRKQFSFEYFNQIAIVLFFLWAKRNVSVSKSNFAQNVCIVLDWKFRK